jgi:hypothetical protein
MSGSSEFASPLDCATAAIEMRGFNIVSNHEEDGVVGFELPNRWGQILPAVVEYVPELGLVQMTAQIMQMKTPFCIELELLHLLNLFNVSIPGVAFTLTFDDEEGDEIELSITHLLTNDVDSEAQIARMLGYMETTLYTCLPALYTFLSQKLIHTIDVNGVWKACRTSVSAIECFRMVQAGRYGSA